MKLSKGKLFVISAPSGCGKGTVIQEVIKNNPKIHYSVSATTRAPREGERDGVNYFFHTKDEFETLIAEGGMLEFAEYCGNYYGTPRKVVEEKLAQGIDVILEIETHGAKLVNDAMPDCVMIFILPPSMSELEKRLVKRGTEKKDIVDARLAQAREEIADAVYYDYVMINDSVDKAIKDLSAIITASKLKSHKFSDKIRDILQG